MTYTPLATDNFNRSNQSGLGSNWTTVPTLATFNINSNTAVPSVLSGTDNGNAYSAIEWPNDQYSKAQLTVTGTSANDSGIGLLARASITGSRAGYILATDHANSNNVSIAKEVAGTYTSVSQTTLSWSNGDTWQLDATNTTIATFHSGSIVFTQTDSSLSSGYPGITLSTTETSASIDNWEGGATTGVFVVDDFNRSNSTGLGVNWSNLYTDGAHTLNISSNQAVPSAFGGDDSGYIYTAFTWPNDQWAQSNLTESGLSNSSGVGSGPTIVLRGSGTTKATISGYLFTVNHDPSGSNATIAKFVNGQSNYSFVGSQIVLSWTDGDLFRFEAQGTNLRTYQNGSIISSLTTTDSSVVSGSAGLYYSTFTPNGTSSTLDNFQGGGFLSTALATDNFNRANSGTLGANWTNASNPSSSTWGISSNTAVAPVTGDDSYATYTAINWQNDQYSQGQISEAGAPNNSPGGGPGLIVRGSGASIATSTFYFSLFNQGATNNVNFTKSISGTWTDLSPFRTLSWTNGDTFRIEAQGTEIRTLQNGLLVPTFIATDSSITSGSPGIYYSTTNGSSDSIDNWEGGSFGTQQFGNAALAATASVTPNVKIQAKSTGLAATSGFDAEIPQILKAEVSWLQLVVPSSSYHVNQTLSATTTLTISGAAQQIVANLSAQGLILTNATARQLLSAKASLSAVPAGVQFGWYSPKRTAHARHNKPPPSSQFNRSDTLVRNLELWFLGDGGGQVSHDIVHLQPNRDATLGGGASWVSGAFGTGALNFNSNDYASVIFGHGLPSGANQPYSISLWVNWNNPSVTRQALVAGGYTPTAEFMFEFFSSGSTQQLSYTYAGNSGWTTPSFVFPTGWHHVAVTDNGTASQTAVTFYLDGQPLGLANQGSNATKPSTFDTYGINFGVILPFKEDPFQGQMDSMMLWSRALTAYEIQRLYIEPFSLLRPTPMPTALGGLSGGGASALLFATSTLSTGGFTFASAALSATSSLTATDAVGASVQRTSFYPNVALYDAPLGLWRLADSSGPTATDSSGRGNSGTYTSVTLAQTGLHPADTTTSAKFDGLTSCVTVPIPSTSDTKLTIEAWVLVNTKTQIQANPNSNVVLFSAASTGTALTLNASTGIPNFTLDRNGGGLITISGATPLTPNIAHHIVGVYTNSSTVNLYVDGVLAATQTFVTDSVSYGTTGNIGASVTGGVPSLGFNGYLEDVAIYATDFAASDVLIHYNGGLGMGARANVLPSNIGAQLSATTSLTNSNKVQASASLSATTTFFARNSGIASFTAQASIALTDGAGASAALSASGSIATGNGVKAPATGSAAASLSTALALIRAELSWLQFTTPPSATRAAEFVSATTAIATTQSVSTPLVPVVGSAALSSNASLFVATTAPKTATLSAVAAITSTTQTFRTAALSATSLFIPSTSVVSSATLSAQTGITTFSASMQAFASMSMQVAVAANEIIPSQTLITAPRGNVSQSAAIGATASLAANQSSQFSIIPDPSLYPRPAYTASFKATTSLTTSNVPINTPTASLSATTSLTTSEAFSSTLTLSLVGQSTTWSNATNWTVTPLGTSIVASTITVVDPQHATWLLTLGQGIGTVSISDGSSTSILYLGIDQAISANATITTSLFTSTPQQQSSVTALTPAVKVQTTSTFSAATSLTSVGNTSSSAALSATTSLSTSGIPQVSASLSATAVLTTSSRASVGAVLSATTALSASDQLILSAIFAASASITTTNTISIAQTLSAASTLLAGAFGHVFASATASAIESIATTQTVSTPILPVVVAQSQGSTATLATVTPFIKSASLSASATISTTTALANAGAAFSATSAFSARGGPTSSSSLSAQTAIQTFAAPCQAVAIMVEGGITVAAKAALQSTGAFTTVSGTGQSATASSTASISTNPAVTFTITPNPIVYPRPAYSASLSATTILTLIPVNTGNASASLSATATMVEVTPTYSFTLSLLGQGTTWSNATVWTLTLHGAAITNSTFSVIDSVHATWTFTLGAGIGTIDVSDGIAITTLYLGLPQTQSSQTTIITSGRVGIPTSNSTTVTIQEVVAVQTTATLSASTQLTAGTSGIAVQPNLVAATAIATSQTISLSTANQSTASLTFVPALTTKASLTSFTLVQTTILLLTATASFTTNAALSFVVDLQVADPALSSSTGMLAGASGQQVAAATASSTTNITATSQGVANSTAVTAFELLIPSVTVTAGATASAQTLCVASAGGASNVLCSATATMQALGGAGANASATSTTNLSAFGLTGVLLSASTSLATQQAVAGSVLCMAAGSVATVEAYSAFVAITSLASLAAFLSSSAAATAFAVAAIHPGTSGVATRSALHATVSPGASSIPQSANLQAIANMLALTTGNTAGFAILVANATLMNTLYSNVNWGDNLHAKAVN